MHGLQPSNILGIMSKRKRHAVLLLIIIGCFLITTLSYSSISMQNSFPTDTQSTNKIDELSTGIFSEEARQSTLGSLKELTSIPTPSYPNKELNYFSSISKFHHPPELLVVLLYPSHYWTILLEASLKTTNVRILKASSIEKMIEENEILKWRAPDTIITIRFSESKEVSILNKLFKKWTKTLVYFSPWGLYEYVYLKPAHYMEFEWKERIVCLHESSVQFPEQLSVKYTDGTIGKKRYWILPSNATFFSEDPTRQDNKETRAPLFYIKGREGDTPEISNITSLVGNTPYNLLKTDWSKPDWRFTPLQYRDGLRNSSHMIAYVSHDYLANFLIEAQSVNVPVFLIMKTQNFMPLSFSHESGMCTDNQNWEAVKEKYAAFADLVKKKHYHPIQRILTTFSTNCTGLLMHAHLLDDHTTFNTTSMVEHLVSHCKHPLPDSQLC